jgi:hypothetical protein
MLLRLYTFFSLDLIGSIPGGIPTDTQVLVIDQYPWDNAVYLTQECIDADC